MNNAWWSGLASLSDAWFAWMIAMSWQVSALIMALTIVGYLVRRRSARFRYAVWTLVPLRLLLPPTLALVTGWGWWLLPPSEAVPLPPVATRVAMIVEDRQEVDTANDVDSDASAWPADDLLMPVNQAADRVALQSELQQAQATELKVADAGGVEPGLTGRQRWQVALFLLWNAVVVAMLFRLVIGFRRVRAMLRESSPANADIATALTECCQHLGMRRRVRVVLSQGAWTPLLVGIRRPVIVLPLRVASALSHAELSAVIMHELQHVVRHDTAMQLLQSLLNVLYFFHPLVWLAHRHSCRLRELACDEATVAALSGNRRDYSSSLIKVAETLVSPQPGTTFAIGMAESSEQVIDRVRRILDPQLRVGRRLSWSGLCVLIVAALFLIPCASRGPVTALATQQPAIEPESTAQLSKKVPAENGPLVMSGRVVDAGQQLVANISVTIRYYQLQAGPSESSVMTDADGRYTISVLARLRPSSVMLLEAKSGDGKQLGVSRVRGEGTTVDLRNLEIVLKPARRIQMKVTDQHGTPLSSANVAVQAGVAWSAEATTDNVGVATLMTPADEPIGAVVAWQDGKGLDYRAYRSPAGEATDLLEFPASGEETLVLDGARAMTIRAIDDEQRPVAGVWVNPGILKKESQRFELNLDSFRQGFTQLTDKDGTATFGWMPRWQQKPLTVFPFSRDFVRAEAICDPLRDEGPLTVNLVRLVPVRGRVTFPDGLPAAGIRIVAGGRGYRSIVMLPGCEEAISDADGRYELLLPPEQIYLVVVQDKRWGAAPQTGFVVNKDQPLEGIDFSLRPATRVHGRLLDEKSGEPLGDQRIYLWQHGTALERMPGVELPNPEGHQFAVQPSIDQSTNTDSSGRFEFHVGSGSFALAPPAYATQQKFSITDEGQRELVVPMKLKQQVTLTGTIVTGEPPQRVAGAKVLGRSTINYFGNDWQAETNAEGVFQVRQMNEASFVQVVIPNRKLAGIARLDGNETEFTLPLKPTSSIRGRLVSAHGARPLPGKEIAYGMEGPVQDFPEPVDRLNGKAVTAADGTFQIDAMVVGEEYHVYFRADDQIGRPARARIITPTVEVMDLGDVKEPAPEPGGRSGVGAVVTAFEVAGTPLERYLREAEFVKVTQQRLLVIFGDPTASNVRALMGLQNEDALAHINGEYSFLPIPTHAERRAEALPLAQLLGERLAGDRDELLLVIMDQDGNKLATTDASALSVNGALSKERVIAWLETHGSKPKTARHLLDEALERAKLEDKRVLLLETASWSRSCSTFTRRLLAHRAWQQDYVLIHIDQRRHDAREVMREFHEESVLGVPWFAILNADGQSMVTSTHPETGNNIGIPASQAEREHFREMLESTRQRMTDEEISGLIKALK